MEEKEALGLHGAVYAVIAEHLFHQSGLSYLWSPRSTDKTDQNLVPGALIPENQKTPLSATPTVQRSGEVADRPRLPRAAELPLWDSGHKLLQTLWPGARASRSSPATLPKTDMAQGRVFPLMVPRVPP